nr:hypothetical protein A6C57_08575 [Fibrella sp. ES10-3-2-2]
MSYADERFERWKLDNAFLQSSLSSRAYYQHSFSKSLTLANARSIDESIYSIPDQIFRSTIGHYCRNQFAILLLHEFGQKVTNELLQKFQIGTSERWPGACVFWVIDEQGRPRGGQVVLFSKDWHKAKYVDQGGHEKPCISSFSSCLLRRYKQHNKSIPAWLTEYDKSADRWPVPFGLHQIKTAPIDQPIAIVEAPKTAVVCSAYFPQFVWLAIGGKSYLTPNRIDRLIALRERKLILYPDLNAYHDTQSREGRTSKGWLQIANELRGKGFQIDVSSHLEENATNEQRIEGLDLADFLLHQPIVKTLKEWRQGTRLRPDPSQLLYL